MRTLSNIEKEISELLKKVNQIQESIEELKRSPDSIPFWYAELINILTDLSDKSGISIFDLKSNSRKRELVEIRQIYFKRARETTTLSLSRISEFIHRDHSNAVYGIKQVNTIPELIKKYDKFYGENSVEEKQYLVPGGKKFVVIPNDFNPPFAELESSNNKPYHGYTKHSL